MRKIHFIIFYFAIFLVSSLSAAESTDIALILKSKGSVKVKDNSTKKWQESQIGMRLNSGDLVKTGDNALAAIMFTDDKSLLKVRDNSSFTIQGQRQESSIAKKIKLTLGSLWVKVQKQDTKFLVETPSGVAAVKGTEFYCMVDNNGNVSIVCIEGLVSLINKLGKTLVNAGETGFSSKTEAPSSNKTKDSEVPTWGDSSDDKENQLEFEFEDPDGNKKTLKINY